MDQYQSNQGNGGGDAQYDSGYGYKRQFEEYGDNLGGVNPPKRQRGQQGGPGPGSEAIEMRLLIPARSAGGIIGRKGANIKELREQFQAQIQIPDSQSMERVLRVFADMQSCSDIILRIIPSINEERRDDRFEASVKLLVHQSQAGTIIGTKGVRIKELREKTGATIKIHQECCPNSTDRICEVSGKPEVVSHCIKLILEVVESAPPKGPVIKFDPDSEQFGGTGGFGDYQSSFNQGGGGFNSMGGAFGGSSFQRGGFNRGGGFRGGYAGRGERGGFGGRGGRGGRGFGGGNSRGGRGRGRWQNSAPAMYGN